MPAYLWGDSVRTLFDAGDDHPSLVQQTRGNIRRVRRQHLEHAVRRISVHGSGHGVASVYGLRRPRRHSAGEQSDSSGTWADLRNAGPTSRGRWPRTRPGLPTGRRRGARSHGIRRPGLRAGATESDSCARGPERQLVIAVAHRLAPGNPAFVSAASKKSFSNASSPILA